MANWTKGFNFRATSGYVTDGSNETYVLEETYPTTRNGVTFGWTTGLGNNHRDRNAGIDRRLAGVNQVVSATVADFRVDLVKTGLHTVGLGLGDAGSDQSSIYIQLLDTSTVIRTIDQTTAYTNSQWYDASGVLRTTDALWVSNQVNATPTMATMLFLARSPSGKSTYLAHIFLETALETWEQEGYRWRDDDGSETTATWAAAQDTDITAPTSVNRRLRVLVDTADGDPGTTQLQLEYKKSTDSSYLPLEVPGGAAAAFGAVGTVTTTGTTAPTVAYPTGITAGQLLIMAVGNRPNASTVATPAGWTAPANNTLTGGAGSEAAGTGVVRVTVFTRVADGTESGSVTLTITGGTTVGAAIWRATRTTGKQWDVALVNGSDSTAGTGVSVTFGSNPGVIAGDLVFVVYINSEDTATFGSFTLAQTGITYGTVTQHVTSAVTTGNDLRLVINQHAVTSGTASAAATWSGTAGGTNAANSAGPAVMIRLRQVDQSMVLSASANIAASGENTTAQLTAPASGSFGGGRLQDDEGLADAVDLSLNQYGEWEWCVQATSVAVNGEVYQFRVTRAGTALDTYPVTPQWTIGSGGGSSVVPILESARRRRQAA